MPWSSPSIFQRSICGSHTRDKRVEQKATLLRRNYYFVRLAGGPKALRTLSFQSFSGVEVDPEAVRNCNHLHGPFEKSHLSSSFVVRNAAGGPPSLKLKTVHEGHMTAIDACVWLLLNMSLYLGVHSGIRAVASKGHNMGCNFLGSSSHRQGYPRLALPPTRCGRPFLSAVILQSRL